MEYDTIMVTVSDPHNRVSWKARIPPNVNTMETYGSHILKCEKNQQKNVTYSSIDIVVSRKFNFGWTTPLIL